MRKVVVNLFPRERRKSSVVGIQHRPPNAAQLARQLGAADEVWTHCRVYNWGAGGAVTIDFKAYQGCFGDEPPIQGNRMFELALTNVNPGTLPWSVAAGDMPTPPDDGTFSFLPKMGLVDFVAVVGGAANDGMEFEIWATLIFHD